MANTVYDPEADERPILSTPASDTEQQRLSDLDSGPDLNSQQAGYNSEGNTLGNGFNPNDIPNSNLRKLGGVLFGSRRRRAISGILVGAGTTVTILSLFFSLATGTLELDHFLNNLDVKTFSRFNASVSGRSDAWLRSYIRVRLMEREGTTDPINGNLFFRSNHVDNNSPFTDWYKTMRTSNFEKDLFDKQGIRFVSLVGADGKFKTAKITLGGNDDPTFNPYDEKQSGLKQHELDILANHPESPEWQRILNKLGGNADHFLNVEIFDSNKEARKSLKNTVVNNTKFYQVIKRRALRKDIANMTGIGAWKFFETSRDKLTNKKIEIQSKVLAKVFNANSPNQKFILCLFGAGPCPSTTDVNDASNHATGNLHGTGNDEGNSDTYNDQTVDNKGNKVSTTNGFPGGSSGLSSEATSAISNAASDTKIEPSNFTQKLLTKIVGEDASPGPQKLWQILKKMAAVDSLLSDNSKGESKLSKLVKNARLVQVVGIYTTFTIARDQMHTGQLVPEEFGAMMGSISNFADSEAWSAVASTPSSTVSAAGVTNPSKQAYCAGNHHRTVNEFAWFCDDEKPNSGGSAQSISNAYSSTIGIIIHPIAQIVHGLENTIGVFADIFSNVVSQVTGPIIDAALSATGLKSTLSQAIGIAINKVLSFVGAGPMITEDPQPGIANLLLAGSAGAAESATRDSGGVLSTPSTLSYSNKLAGEYTTEQARQQSAFARYASLSNSNSLISRFAMNVASIHLGTFAATMIGGLAHIPSSIGNALTSSVSAGTPANSASYAQLAGVDTYDIPQTCMELDPTDSDYVNKATNIATVTQGKVVPTWDMLNNSDSFWQAAYGWAGDDETKQSQLMSVYNCATLDQRVRGGLGYTSGYTADGGYGG